MKSHVFTGIVDDHLGSCFRYALSNTPAGAEVALSGMKKRKEARK